MEKATRVPKKEPGAKGSREKKALSARTWAECWGQSRHQAPPPSPKQMPQHTEDLPGPKAGRTDTGPQPPTVQKVLSLLKQSAPKNPPLQTQNL